MELSVRIDFDIAPDGWAQIAYRQELLNLTAKPLARTVREVWFEHSDGPLTITPITEGDRHLMIQQVHDTSNLAKFACQLSPPLQPSESTMIGHMREGGRRPDGTRGMDGIRLDRTDVVRHDPRPVDGVLI